MKLSNLSNTLLVAFSFTLGVSAWCKDKNVNTYKTCSTEYGSYQVYDVPTSIKTITSKTSITITITPPPITYFVTEKDKTITDDATVIYTITKDKCRTKKVYVTSHVTSIYTITRVKTDTKSVTTTVTAHKTNKPYPDDHYGHPDKRHNDYKYPKKVKCTKTLKTTFTCITTAKPTKVTVTVPGGTVTVTNTYTITTKVCPKITKTITITETDKETTKTKTTTTLTKTYTVTVRPKPDPCGNHNIYRGSNGNVEVDLFKWDPQVPAKNAYECCKACYKHVNYAGVHDCAGSYFATNKKSKKSKCWLKLTDKCYPSYKQNCKAGPKNYGYDGSVSNGPCGQWDYKH